MTPSHGRGTEPACEESRRCPTVAGTTQNAPFLGTTQSWGLAGPIRLDGNDEVGKPHRPPELERRLVPNERINSDRLARWPDLGDQLSDGLPADAAASVVSDHEELAKIDPFWLDTRGRSSTRLFQATLADRVEEVCPLGVEPEPDTLPHLGRVVSGHPRHDELPA